MARYRTKATVEAHRWWKNGDHPDDYAEDRPGIERGEFTIFPAAVCAAWDWEGAVVRRFRHPDVPGTTECHICARTMHDHGFLEPDVAVCPGDYIVREYGLYRAVRAEVFERDYEEV